MWGKTKNIRTEYEKGKGEVTEEEEEEEGMCGKMK
jgi:hypothetical protein